MAFRTLTAILVLPAVISLALLLVNAAWYQSSVSRMEEVAALKPVVSTDIPEMVRAAPRLKTAAYTRPSTRSTALWTP